MCSNNPWTEDDLEKKYLDSSVFNFITTKLYLKMMSKNLILTAVP